MGQGAFVEEASIEENVGARIRHLRKARRFTLEQLAERAGISKSVLSKIENGKVSSPISTYSHICSALNVSLADLFSEEDGEDPIFVRKGERRLLSRRGSHFGYTYYSLAHNRLGRRMAPFLLIYPHGLEEIPTFHHGGEEFVFILKGKLEFVYGDQTLILSEGDSLYIDGQFRHGARALGGRDCEALVIGTSYS
ncbi:MAG: helix-turn-helix domain-containing protein [Nitrospinota bacterium]